MCLDDFGRSSVASSEILGFANNLRDEHRLNVVLIYNEEELATEPTYSAYREKIIDREFPFVIDVEMAVSIATSEPEIRTAILLICRTL